MWLAFFRLTPTAAELDERQAYRHAETLTLLANAYRNPKKRAQPWRVEDFLPQELAPEPTQATLAAKIMAANAALGGRVRIH